MPALDRYILNTKYQTLDSTSCFIDGALETAKEIMLIQAHPSDNDIEIIDHYTDSEMRLQSVGRVHQNTRSIPEAEILAKRDRRMSVKVTGKSLGLWAPYSITCLTKSRLCVCQFLKYCNLG
jgi:hypothetical protein